MGSGPSCHTVNQENLRLQPYLNPFVYGTLTVGIFLYPPRPNPVPSTVRHYDWTVSKTVGSFLQVPFRPEISPRHNRLYRPGNLVPERISNRPRWTSFDTGDEFSTIWTPSIDDLLPSSTVRSYDPLFG